MMTEATEPSRTSRFVTATWILLATLLVLATAGLWARHGSSIFLEMLVAGWTACFG